MQVQVHIAGAQCSAGAQCTCTVQVHRTLGRAECQVQLCQVHWAGAAELARLPRSDSTVEEVAVSLVEVRASVGLVAKLLVRGST